MDAHNLQVMADFNGLFSGLLCLSHEDTIKTRDGTVIALNEGMRVTAWEENCEDGKKG